LDLDLARLEQMDRIFQPRPVRPQGLRRRRDRKGGDARLEEAEVRDRPPLDAGAADGAVMMGGLDRDDAAGFDEAVHAFRAGRIERLDLDRDLGAL
jgi:hypothetical protein